MIIIHIQILSTYSSALKDDLLLLVTPSFNAQRRPPRTTSLQIHLLTVLVPHRHHSYCKEDSDKSDISADPFGRGSTTQPTAFYNLPCNSDYAMASCSFEFIFDEIPQSTKDYCLRFPWFTTLVNDASLQPIRSPERRVEGQSGNAFLARTLNTKETIPACQSFYKSPSFVTIPGGPPNLGELQTFYSLGSGLDGHEGFCHGGSLSTAMDQTMGTLARAYPNTHPYTKYLHINFEKPLRTPGAVLCRVWLARIDGRKLWVSGRMEDGQGDLYVTAEALFVNVGPKL